MTESLHKQVTQECGTLIVTARSTASAVRKIAGQKDAHHQPVNQPVTMLTGGCDQIGGERIS
jgi:hypothetical protein